MKSVQYTKYGSPANLSVVQLSKPKVGAVELLIKVQATTVTAADIRLRAARFPKGFALPARLVFGVLAPRRKILGSCFSGVVEATGDNVANFAVGDHVCGMTGIKMGTYAEYICVKAGKSVVKKPTNVSHEDAAGVLFGGTAALYFVRNKGNVTKGQKVLVNGAAGSVGTNAVQLATLFGAEVTAVAKAKNESLLKSLGAGSVIDYETHSIYDNHEKYDVVLDTVGNISPKKGKILLKSNGLLLLMVANLLETIKARGQVKTGTATEKAEDIAYLMELVADKKLKVVIDTKFTLEQMAEAHNYAESGDKTGNIVVRVA